MRIGHGFDAHRFGGDNPLILGGVEVEHTQGLLAHSDGDVLIHSLCDALLGAAALGDIGRHFPDTDAQYKNVDSRQLLRHVVKLINERAYRIVNVDVTVIAQVPKLKPYIEEMRSVLAGDLQIELNQLNIKATTTEGMGYIGRKEGISVHVVCLIDEV